jgi:sRNA-binding carbon storage regulator CsrA
MGLVVTLDEEQELIIGEIKIKYLTKNKGGRRIRVHIEAPKNILIKRSNYVFKQEGIIK